MLFFVITIIYSTRKKSIFQKLLFFKEMQSQLGKTKAIFLLISGNMNDNYCILKLQRIYISLFVLTNIC